jgi:hypothetical protein
MPSSEIVTAAESSSSYLVDTLLYPFGRWDHIDLTPANAPLRCLFSVEDVCPSDLQPEDQGALFGRRFDRTVHYGTLRCMRPD